MTPERFQKIKDVLSRRQPDLTVVMDHVHKPHNLAAIIRSCDAIGIGDIHGVSRNEQKVGVNLKAASGSNHWVNLHIHDTVPSVFDTLKKQGYKIYTANNSINSVDFRDVDYTLPSAIVLGAELDGISNDSIQLADKEIRIPMDGMVGSLNVSVANAVILFEVQRQRQKAGLYKERRLDDTLYKTLLFEFAYPEVAAVLKRKSELYPELDKEGQIIR